MWLNDFKYLSIYKSRYVNILTNNVTEQLNDLEDVKEYKIALNHQECQELLATKAKSIEILKVQGDVNVNNFDLEYFKFSISSFDNLKELHFKQMAVTNEHLNVIAENCLQLTSLRLIECFCQHFQDLIPGININMDSICNIKQLEELEIQPKRAPGTVIAFQFKYFQQLLNSLIKLNALTLTNFTIVCENDEQNILNIIHVPFNAWPLRILNVGSISLEFWSTFISYLKFFPQLRALTINVSENENEDENVVVNITVIDILSKYCKGLEILKLENCEINIEDFRSLENLQELTVNSCVGLTFNNFQQILGGLKLKTFQLINTRIFEIQNYIYISSSLKSITIDTPHAAEISEMFQRSLNNFSGLESLEWLNGNINHNWIVDKCRQLQQLHISNPYNLYRIVGHMYSLRELTFTSCNALSWGLLKILLFNLSLKRLNIHASNAYGFNEDTADSQIVLKMQTTLELISMPYELFAMGVKHWLELYNANEGLRLLCYGRDNDILSAKFLSLLLAIDCVRKRCNRINICGFHLELENFENNTILKQFAQLQINTNHYKLRKVPFTLEM